MASKRSLTYVAGATLTTSLALSLMSSGSASAAADAGTTRPTPAPTLAISSPAAPQDEIEAAAAPTSAQTPQGVQLRAVGADGKLLRAPVLPGWYVSSSVWVSGRTSFGGTVAHGPYRVGYVYVSALLYRKRWYGWQLRAKASDDGHLQYQLSTVARKGCSGLYTYRVNSTAKVRHNGRTYWGSSTAKTRKRCR